MSDDREQMAFRLPTKQMRDVEKAARSLRQTKQAFVEEAVLSKLADIAEDRRLKGLRYKDDEKPEPKRESDEGRPAGLGIAEALKQQQRRSESTYEPSTPAQAPVVVNVGNNNNDGAKNTASTDVVDRLAAYVLAGSDFERPTRRRTAAAVLHASASTDEERAVLTARLDEAVATKVKTSGNGVVRAAHVAFDKLANFLK